MILIFISAILISAYLFKITSGSLSLTKLNMMSWIFWFDFIAGSAIAAILVVYKLDDNYLIEKIYNDKIRFYGYLAIMYTIIMFPVGMAIANLIFKKRIHNQYSIEQYMNKSITEWKNYYPNKIKLILYFLSVLSIISVIYVLFCIGGIPIFSIFSNLSSLSILEYRISVGRHFIGNEYVKNIFGLMLTPILSYISYAYYLRSNNYKDFLWFLIMMLFSISIITYDYSKSPLIVYLIGFLFLNIYSKGQIKKIYFVRFVLIGFILLLFSYFFTLSITTDFSFDQVNIVTQSIINRIFLTQSAGTFLSFDIFPIHGRFIGFSSLSPIISGLFNIPYSERSARIIMESVNLHGVIMDQAGVVNSLFVAEAWANFGLFGVIFSPIYVGFIIQTLYLFFLKSPKTPLTLGIFSFLSSRGSITGGINDYLYNVPMFALVIILLLISLLSHKGKTYSQ